MTHAKASTKLQRRLLKQVEILRAFVNGLSNIKVSYTETPAVLCDLVYAAQEIMEAVRKLDRGLPDE